MNSATKTFSILCASALLATGARPQPPAAACAALSHVSSPPRKARTGRLATAILRPTHGLHCGLPSSTHRLQGFATWYCRASCRREGTGGKQILMANGKPLDDQALTCALWLTNSRGRPRRPDGRIVTVRHVQTGRTIKVAWTDNGPGRVPRSRGVVIDLSRAAMVALAGEAGIRSGGVEVEVLK